MFHRLRSRLEHDRRFARGDRGFDGPHLGRHWHGGGRGRSGLGRFFAHGDLKLVILNLIAEKPRHGYEIIKAIEEQVGGAYSPSPGVIYPTLTLLEELGYVTVRPSADGTKKLHEVTAEGKAYLDANRASLDPLLARMAESSRALGDGPAPQIVRAMENLKLALRLRLGRGPLTAEQADAVAAALDAAVSAVERS
jgi:DNA-binding PadR family transcriptional regulator